MLSNTRLANRDLHGSPEILSDRGAMRFEKDRQPVPGGSGKQRFHQAEHLIFILQTPSRVHRETEILATGVLRNNAIRLCGSVDAVKTTVGQSRATQGQITGCELHAFKAISLQALVTSQTVQARPGAVNRQTCESVKIEEHSELWRILRAIVQQAGHRS